MLKNGMRGDDSNTKPFRSIAFYRGGVKIFGDRVVGNPTGKGGGRRGVITQWSKSSRRNMRDFLLTHNGPRSWVPCGITLTLPGPVVSLEDSKRVWEKFRSWCKNQKHCGVWRVEVQKREALHWHLLLWADYSVLYRKTAVWLGEDETREPERHRDFVQWVMNTHFKEGWNKAIDILGPCEGPFKMRGEIGILKVAKRSAWIGAEEHACKVSLDDGRGAWLRYLQDHSTKCKQEQVPENIGRHWGKINERLLDRVLPDDVVPLYGRGWFGFLRAYQRLCTSSRKKDGVPFGRRLNKRMRFGAFGSTVRFSRPEIVRKLAEFYHSKPEPVKIEATPPEKR